MSNTVVTFGEIMLRLSTPGFQRFVQVNSFDATYGGGEANVAASLSNYGINSKYVTKVSDNAIGQAAINHLQRYGVKTDHVAKGGNRLGIYFLETGASQRPSVVIYDRAASAIAEADSEDFDWEEIFTNASWFHFSGITPALSDKAAEITLEACQAASNMNLTVSCDLNYRKKLWSSEKANKIMSGLMPYVNVVIANEEDADKVFGIKAPSSDVEKGLISRDSYKNVAEQLLERYNLQGTAITLRESYSASDNGWSGLFYDGAAHYFSKQYQIRIVDRVGGGDSFAAGLIYGSLQKWNPQKIIEFAAAASCLKHTIVGDFNIMSVEEVQKLAGGEASGRVQR